MIYVHGWKYFVAVLTVLSGENEMANVNGSDVQNAMIKAVYIKNSEIQQDRPNRISDFEIYESLHLKVGCERNCIQLERDLWRVYLKTKEAGSLLISEGFELRNVSVQVYDSNPYSTGASGPDDKVIKVSICGLPLSADDRAVLEMLYITYKIAINMRTYAIPSHTE